MSPLEELELEWFFSAGQVAFERSTCGGMLERAEMFSVARHAPAPLRAVYARDGEVIAHEREITARPTAELRAPAGYMPDGNTLQRYAVVSTRLKRLAARSRKHALVLECLYGDFGQRWVGNDHHGRVGAIYHLTVKGRALIDQANAIPGAIELPDIARMEVICAVQRVQPKPERGQALAYCRTQAQAMAQAARAAWSLVRPARAA